MCRFERNTARRGRSAVPDTCLRTRRCRRIRCSRFCSARMLRLPLRGLAGLLPDPLALVPDALALVRLGLAELPDVRGHLADLLLVDPTDGDPVRRWHLELDPLRAGEHDGVREAQRQLEVAPPHRPP